MQPKMIRVDQALHGYSRGHKELASSVELDERSRTTMLMMSDLLAVIDLPPDESYLTIYPLKSASRHVVARTWAAGRSYRPGSVWTHSLILDYQALTLITDLVSLLSHFLVPAEGASREYEKPLKVDANQRSSHDLGSDERISAALRQLYGPNPQQQIVLPHVTAERDELLTLAIWRQMWPSMRRDFSALTNLGDGSVHFESGCTLRFANQAVPNDDEFNPTIEAGLKELEADFSEPGPTPLRGFLGRYAIEAQEPRRLAAALAVSRVDNAHPIDFQFRRLRDFNGGVSLPRFDRDLLTQEFKSIDSAARLLSFVRSARNEKIDFDLSAIVELASGSDIDDLRDLIASTEPSAPGELGAKLHTRLLESLPIDRLARIATEDQRLRMTELRPEILHVPCFWPDDDGARAALVSRLAPGAFDISDALKVFGTSIGVQTLSALIDDSVDLPPNTVVSLLKVDESAVREEMAAWAVSSPTLLRLIANKRHVLDQRAIEALAEAQTRQRGPLSDMQSWREFIEAAIEAGSSRAGALNVIGYVCSLAGPANETLRIAKAVFDPLHSALRSRTLSRDEDRYLSKNISAYSRSWPLSKAIIQSALLKWPVTPLQAGALSITQSESVQDEIVDEILAKNSKQGLEALLQAPHLPERARAEIRRRLMQSKSKKSNNPWSWLFDD